MSIGDPRCVLFAYVEVELSYTQLYSVLPHCDWQNGRTALQIARMNGDSDITRLLLAKSNTDRTVVMYVLTACITYRLH